ncbi:methyltransferase type 11 [candidate division WOR-1 bacterium DG_54_3]|uniref:Methyltransferase type 11 n=1 Tax=candidate division WOR-1 bacterium DG_54_3 TaxID=1703775 RepID=A0A0S7XWY0_UNCSA|nr:MAG: methyltransferase type 11 [candidate division WOR-1 bacterium DG_54_3]
MCNAYCTLFGAINLDPEDVKGKRVIEIGSCDTNGSLRPLVESYYPAEYIGVDIADGPGVDMICKAEDILDRFGKESFDIVISTELLEHIWDWRKVVGNIKNICKEGGIILITTRSYGHPYHGHPYDFWRYELEDMKHIFSDCLIEKLEKDPANGVLVEVKKTREFEEKDLADYKLYSILLNKRVKEIAEKDIKKYSKRLILMGKIRNFLSSIKRLLS